MIPPDVKTFVARKFRAEEQAVALALLDAAVIHDGSAAGPQLVRCAAVASGGSLERLRREVDSLRRDFRDVIVEGEYVPVDGCPVRVRNLAEPIPDDA